MEIDMTDLYNVFSAYSMYIELGLIFLSACAVYEFVREL